MLPSKKKDCRWDKKFSRIMSKTLPKPLIKLLKIIYGQVDIKLELLTEEILD